MVLNKEMGGDVSQMLSVALGLEKTQNVLTVDRKSFQVRSILTFDNCPKSVVFLATSWQ